MPLNMTLMSVALLFEDHTRPVPDPWRRDELAEYTLQRISEAGIQWLCLYNNLHEEVTNTERPVRTFI